MFASSPKIPVSRNQRENKRQAMPRDGAIIFSDLIGKLPVVRVACTGCPRQGLYILPRLIRAYGPRAKLVDWIDMLTADCPKRIANDLNDQCGVRCPEVAKVL